MTNSPIHNLKKTPLYDYYRGKDVKLTDFGGWALPIQFTKIQEEHEAVRNKVGLFDVSHMGEIEISGEKAESWLNKIVTNDIKKMKTNQSQYNTIVNDNGGVIDDLLVFKFTKNHYWLTPNASNTTKVLQWLKENNPLKEAIVEDISDKYGLIALQGPAAKKVLAKITDSPLSEMKPFHFLDQQTVTEVDGILISRTGYTGEDGFELYVNWEETFTLWKALVAAGEEEGLLECGLGARDTLRLEAGLSLYGQDLTEEISPFEGGISFAVKLQKESEFIGKQKLKKQKENGVERVSRGFELRMRGIAREGHIVFSQDGEEIGVVTSGTQSPSLGKSIGMMMVKKEHSTFDSEVFIQVRKKKIPTKITKKNWIKQIKEE